ncbi:MAG: hypothetical protein ABSG38_07390 [Spirochaetia bacterium]|jgi:hypothetical protein
MERELSILNGGDLVGLNGFTKKIVMNTLLGMLQSLHDVDVEREIRIVISAAGSGGNLDRSA